MLELTREEAINILRTLSMFEGFLFSVEGKGASEMNELLEIPVGLLMEKLKND